MGPTCQLLFLSPLSSLLPSLSSSLPSSHRVASHAVVANPLPQIRCCGGQQLLAKGAHAPSLSGAQGSPLGGAQGRRCHGGAGEPVWLSVAHLPITGEHHLPAVSCLSRSSAASPARLLMLHDSTSPSPSPPLLVLTSVSFHLLGYGRSSAGGASEGHRAGGDWA